MPRRPMVFDLSPQPGGLASLATGAAQGFAQQASAMDEETRREQLRQSILRAQQEEDANRQLLEQQRYERNRADTLADREASQRFQQDMLAQRTATSQDLYQQRRQAELSDAEQKRQLQLADEQRRQAADQQAATDMARRLGIPAGPVPGLMPVGGVGQAIPFTVNAPTFRTPQEVLSFERAARPQAQGQQPADPAQIQQALADYANAQDMAGQLQAWGRVRQLGIPLQSPNQTFDVRTTIQGIDRELSSLDSFSRLLAGGNGDIAARVFLEQNGIDPRTMMVPDIVNGRQRKDANGNPAMTVDIAAVSRIIGQRMQDLRGQRQQAAGGVMPQPTPQPQTQNDPLEILNELDDL